MKEFDLLDLNRYRAPKISDHVAIIGEVTKIMQIRAVRIDKDGSYYSIFSAGADVITLANGNHIIISTLGMYGFSFVEFMQRYVEYLIHTHGRERGVAFILTDDSDALSTWNYDEDGNIVDENVVEPTVIEDKILTQGLNCYNSLDEFVESLQTLGQS